MAFNQSILQLIAKDGVALTDFLTTTPELWADKQMQLRYGTARLESDDLNSFPMQCWKLLCDEYSMLRTWFTDDGKLNITLQSASIQNRLTGPIGDGVGWDFKTNGDSEHRMTYFKGVLIAATRAAALLPPNDRNNGNAQFGGLLRFVNGAYNMRAEVHRWRTIEMGGVVYSPTDMSRRWVAMQTYTFVMRLGADNRKWAWEASKCIGVFGPFDDTEIAG